MRRRFLDILAIGLLSCPPVWADQRLFDVWGLWAASDDPAVLDFAAEAYSGTELMLEVGRFDACLQTGATARHCLSRPESSIHFIGSPSKGLLQLVARAREAGHLIQVNLDTHNNGRGELQAYHQSNVEGWRIFPPIDSARERAWYEAAIRAALPLLDPDEVVFENEPYFSRTPERWTESTYHDFVRWADPIVRSIVPGVWTQAAHFPSASDLADHPLVGLLPPADEDLAPEAIGPIPTDEVGRHSFVFAPNVLLPEDLGDLVAADTRDMRDMYPGKAVSQDEAAGVGDHSTTDSQRGADLTEALLGGAFSAGARSVNLLLIGPDPAAVARRGGGRVCNVNWGVCMNQLRADGWRTPTALRVRQFARDHGLSADPWRSLRREIEITTATVADILIDVDALDQDLQRSRSRRKLRRRVRKPLRALANDLHGSRLSEPEKHAEAVGVLAKVNATSIQVIDTMTKADLTDERQRFRRDIRQPIREEARRIAAVEP